MNIWQSIVMGIVEGLTEFLPVSSTGHLTIAADLMGLDIDDPSVTAYTAVIQVGAIAAVLIYFWRDIARLLSRVGPRACSTPSAAPTRTTGWPGWSSSARCRSSIVGFLGRDLIKGPLRSLWWVAGALIVWGVRDAATPSRWPSRTGREPT